MAASHLRGATLKASSTILELQGGLTSLSLCGRSQEGCGQVAQDFRTLIDDPEEFTVRRLEEGACGPRRECQLQGGLGQ